MTKENEKFVGYIPNKNEIDPQFLEVVKSVLEDYEEALLQLKDR